MVTDGYVLCLGTVTKQYVYRGMVFDKLAPDKSSNRNMGLELDINTCTVYTVCT